MERVWLLVGAIAGGSAVGLSALKAHVLADRLGPSALAMLDAALTMQAWHALALLAAAALARRIGTLAHIAGGFFVAGLVLFCGTIQVAAVTGIRLGPVAPLGGTAFMLGWLCLAAAAFVRWRGG